MSEKNKKRNNTGKDPAPFMDLLGELRLYSKHLLLPFVLVNAELLPECPLTVLG